MVPPLPFFLIIYDSYIFTPTTAHEKIKEWSFSIYACHSKNECHLYLGGRVRTASDGR